MSQDDRRKSPRIPAKVSLKHKPNEGVAPFMSSGESINISDEGLYFMTDSVVQPGSAIDISFVMPSQVTGTTPMKIRCTARVIRVEHEGQAEGRTAIAAHIERFETIVAE